MKTIPTAFVLVALAGPSPLPQVALFLVTVALVFHTIFRWGRP